MPLNYAGKTLRGLPFKPDEDLREANFSHADIRGANFTKAILKGATFSYAKAGLQRRWVISLVIISLILSVLSGFTSFVIGFFTINFFLPDNIKQFTIIPGIVFLIVLAAFFIITIRQGLVQRGRNNPPVQVGGG